jgi:hypothetical protein
MLHGYWYNLVRGLIVELGMQVLLVEFFFFEMGEPQLLHQLMQTTSYFIIKSISLQLIANHGLNSLNMDQPSKIK